MKLFVDQSAYDITISYSLNLTVLFPLPFRENPELGFRYPTQVAVSQRFGEYHQRGKN